VLASGIGNPEAFARGVRTLGARVVHHETATDHHAWTQTELDALARRAGELSATHVLTTEKDAVKLAELAWPEDAPPLRAIGVEVAITDGEDAWNALLAEVLKGR
jgi:tetraacyldisaccharide 4'-kinase